MTYIRRGPEHLQSKRHSLVDSKCTITANDCGELSDFIRIYLVPPADQSVLIRDGIKLSYRKRRGEVMRYTFQFSNNSMSGVTKQEAINFDDVKNVEDDGVV